MAKRPNAHVSRSVLPKDEAWIRRHFDDLIEKYAGQYAVVAEGELFVGHDAARLEAAARHKYPRVIPSGLRIPRPEDFTCALLSRG